MTPTVSVVIPTYCRRAYLVEALESLLSQTYADFEAIVGNDGGLEYIEPVKARFTDERISWVDHCRRKGLFGNILDGFSRVQGKYVATLHDDDRWDPHFLATLVPRLEHDRSISVAFCDHYIIDESGRVDTALSDRFTDAAGRAGLQRGVHRPIYKMAIADKSLPMQVAAVFRRDRLGLSSFPAQAGTAYDLWLARQMARDGAGAWYEPARLAFNRQHPMSQTSARTLENARANVYLYRVFLADPELDVVPRRLLRQQLADHHYAAGVTLIREGRPRPARPELVHSLALGRRRRLALAFAASFLPAVAGRRL
jgi:glycosyltransferase involved in cell wall biosynthesis